MRKMKMRAKMKQSKELTALERQIALILMKAGVTAPEIDQCIFWAFGEDAWFVPPADWANRWNMMHPGFFRIDSKDSFIEVIAVVGHAYMNTKYGEENPNPFGLN